MYLCVSFYKQNLYFFIINIMKYLLSLLSIIIFLSSCKYKNEWHQVTIDNKFSADIPDYMEVSKKLRADASLQYENRYRNTYFIVIEHEKKNQDLKLMDVNCVAPLMKYLDKPVITDSADVSVNGLPARMNKVMGEMQSGDDKENIYYTHYLVDGKKKYYELCTWTRGPKRLDQYGKDLQRMMDSFKEI